jgi:hypothetical protein
MEIMRLGNHSLPIASRERLRDFLMYCGKWIKLPANKDVEMLGAAQRAKLLRRFQPIHAYLNKVAGTQSFFPNIESMASARPLPYVDAARQALAQMTPAVLAELRDVNARTFLETLHNETMQAKA